MLTCDHASRRIPRALGTLGLTATELCSHIAWDIGAARVAALLSERLDATLVVQNYSRLVIDCNRLPSAADSIPVQSESVRISANERLAQEDIDARRSEIFVPYHAGLTAALDRRRRESRGTLLIAIHSFTPTYHGISRPWQIGVMYRHDRRLAHALLEQLCRDQQLCVGDNLPYAIEEECDYSLPLHGEGRGIPHVGIEIRQDLIADATGQARWAQRLAQWLTQAADLLGASDLRLALSR